MFGGVRPRALFGARRLRVSISCPRTAVRCGVWRVNAVVPLSVADALSLSKRRAKVTVEQHVRFVTFGEVQLNVQESEGEIGTHEPVEG